MLLSLVKEEGLTIINDLEICNGFVAGAKKLLKVMERLELLNTTGEN